MTTTTKPKHNTLYLLFITTITLLIIISWAHCSPTSSYPLSYVGVQSGKNLTRLNLEFSRSGLQNVQLIVSNLNNNDQDSFPKDEMVKVSIGELGIFTTAFNLTQCEKFIVDVDRRTLAPTHIEQFNCNKGNVAPITITPTATTTATTQQARATSIQKAKLQQQQQASNQQQAQQQIVYLRTSLRDSAQQLSKQAGKVSFEGVLTPKTDKEQADQQNNQSFFRKYWYYIVPVVLMLVVSSLGVEDDQQGGRAAAPAQ